MIFMIAGAVKIIEYKPLIAAKDPDKEYAFKSIVARKQEPTGIPFGQAVLH